MKYLKIQNNGELDIRLVSLMGGSTKQNNQFKIGQFGSGLKYVLAYLFRNGIDFKIVIDGKQLDLGIVEETIQNTDFKIITVNGEKTSITTSMGLDWKPWMIIRELYSNALDEGGEVVEIVTEINNVANTTQFYIELTPEFLNVYNNWTNYFINKFIPIWDNNNYAIHAQEGPLRIYKQGILIKEYDEKSLFNYDIKNASINELREYQGTTSCDLTACLFQLDCKRTINYFLTNLTEKHFEGNMDYDWSWVGKFNDVWKEVIGNAKIIHQEALNKLKGAQPYQDYSDLIVVPKVLFKALTKQFDGISSLRVVDKINEFYEIIDADLELKVKQALVILEESSYFIHPELKFIFGEFGDKKVLAQINIDAKEILVSQKMKDKSMFDFVTMLIEENEHYQTGYSDNTREFQQHFIDLYTKSLLDKAEIKL